MNFKTIFLSVGLVALGLLMVVNGTIMIISPRKWFDLPLWLAGHGTLKRENHESGWGSMTVRILGGAMLAIVIYWCYVLSHT